jgi:hypothetical protein
MSIGIARKDRSCFSARVIIILPDLRLFIWASTFHFQNILCRKHSRLVFEACMQFYNFHTFLGIQGIHCKTKGFNGGILVLVPDVLTIWPGKTA